MLPLAGIKYKINSYEEKQQTQQDLCSRSFLLRLQSASRLLMKIFRNNFLILRNEIG